MNRLGFDNAIRVAALSVPAFGGPGFMPVSAAMGTLSLSMLAAGVWLLRGH